MNKLAERKLKINKKKNTHIHYNKKINENRIQWFYLNNNMHWSVHGIYKLKKKYYLPMHFSMYNAY